MQANIVQPHSLLQALCSQCAECSNFPRYVAVCSIDRPAADVHAALAGARDPASLARLFAHDQLRAALASDPAHPLAPFAEAVHPLGAPPFPPSYKYVPGKSCEYDTRRTPSWTDRILWRCNYAHATRSDGASDDGARASPVAQTQYAALAAACRSDHKPVVATFQVALKHSAPVATDDAVDAVSAYLGGGAATRGRGRRKWLGVKQRGVGASRAPAGAAVVPLATAPLQVNAAVL